jgi:hypothetical protein
VALTAKLACMLALDLLGRQILYCKATRFMPVVVNLAFNNTKAFLQARIYSCVVLSNLIENEDICASILFDYDGLNLVSLFTELLLSDCEV